MKTILFLFTATLVAALGALDAAAQMNNKPYSFPGSGGPGMSVAGKQAIILREIDPGFSPHFLLRAPNGGLLTVTPNPQGSDVPLVFAPDGTLLPSYRRSYRSVSGTRVFGAGVFNPYFDGGGGSAHYASYPGAGGDSIAVWTARVSGPGGFGVTGDSINDWTGAAYFLGSAY